MCNASSLFSDSLSNNKEPARKDVKSFHIWCKPGNWGAKEIFIIQGKSKCVFKKAHIQGLRQLFLKKVFFRIFIYPSQIPSTPLNISSLAPSLVQTNAQ